MAEKEEVKTETRSSRDRFMERLKGRYPDREFADDESIYEQANSDYDDYDKRIGEYDEKNKRIGDLFATNPKSAVLFRLWGEGKDPVVESVRMYGKTFKEALEDPAKLDEIAAINKDMAEKVAKEKEYEDIYTGNVEQSRQNFNEMFDKYGCSEEEKTAVCTALKKMMTDAILGLFDKQTIESAIKSVRHDTDVENASMEGEVRGRNKKIVERERKRSKGDGIPTIGGNNGGAGGGERPSRGAIDRYNTGYSNIFERGGEKRYKH